MPQHFYDDEEIMGWLCSGDARKQKEILLFLEKHWKPMAYNIVVKQGGGDESQAEGIYDEAIAELIQQLCKKGKYDSKKSKLSTYFCGIVQNKWLKFRRDVIEKGKREKEAYLESEAEEESIEERLISREEKKAFADILENILDEECRKIFIGYWYEGRSLKELSQEMEISHSNIKKKHQRCREKLRELLEKRGY